jgi:metallo-beta-lactamase class B
MNRFSLLVLASFLISACGPKQLEPDTDFECSNCEDWNRLQEPFRLYGNTWYVGAAGLSSILIETSNGLILIDGGLPQTAALIDANLKRAGFDPLDISAILVSHPHYDHAGGVAALQRLTGATVYTSVEGAKVLRSGKLQSDDPQFAYGPANTSFAAIKNVVTIADHDKVSIADVDVTAVYTPGHTPGSISWTWESCVLGTCYDVVYADSLTAVSAQGYRFSAGPAANQLIESAGIISELNCDILLSPHPFFFGMQDKLEKRDEGNPFVNNVACMMYAESSLDWLQQRLNSEGAQKIDPGTIGNW